VCVETRKLSTALVSFMSNAFAFEIPATSSEPVEPVEPVDPSLSDELATMRKFAEHIRHNHEQLAKVAKRIEKRLGTETKELEASWTKFAETTVAVEGALDKCKGRVKLNVGGVKYETTLTTLTADGDDSMLGSMFSGRHALHPNEDGEIFIDRDGKHFGHILNVLRDSSVAVNINDRMALATELQYHGISEERCKRLVTISDHNGNRCRFDVFGRHF